ncbi:hypothetical protein WH96_13780 [Kiloniella spongiae]|uniref:Uncharacterized protein n=1 Tax=Kiloniella spongiae TaxID=1489064 RepID=A0A0H2MDE8_9PROT|nr:hypothetical protein [Kiloniella spongiae]KLN60246.1 hypothetical protein WH96_13780 [Kiloniella spongiae]
MTLDIRGSLKNTKVSHSPFVVIDELLSNAIDSYLILNNASVNPPDFQASFEIEFKSVGGTDDAFDLKILCCDNGSGFGDDEKKAFITKDTSYKDDLDIQGIGQCKGSGRIQYLHFFENMNIDSVFASEDGLQARTLTVNADTKEIGHDTFETQSTTRTHTGTTVTLDVLKDRVFQTHFLNSDIREVFSAMSLKNHVIVSFLQRLISLQTFLGDFSIKFRSTHDDQSFDSEIIRADLPDVTEKVPVVVSYGEPFDGGGEQRQMFTINHYKLEQNKFNIGKNTIALCAKNSIVKDITPEYLKTKTYENRAQDGYFHIILIDSEFLDETVNEQRDDFDISPKSDKDTLFYAHAISYEEIVEGLSDSIAKMITPPTWDKDELRQDINEKFGITSGMIVNANVKIQYGDTDEKVVNRVLSSYQKKVVQDTADLIDMKEAIQNADPGKDDFREMVQEISWKYASTLKNMDVLNLSQLVVRRSAIVEVLRLAVKKELLIQDVPEGQRRRDESIIHNIFFPMQKDSIEVTDHDVWVLSEEYQYFDYIASDKQLSQYRWKDDEYLFDEDIDEEIQALMNKISSDNEAKRPDIAIFSHEGVAVIIELKAPDVSMDNHVGDLMEYAQIILAKSKGNIKKIYGYLIGGTVNPIRLQNYTAFANGKGWFNSAPITEHTTQTHLGELYSEILFYEDVVDRAEKRLEAFKERLNLDF